MQEHSLHQEGSDLGGSPKGGEGNPSGQATLGESVRPQQVEADYRDETIQSFAKNILRLGNECRALANENKTLKAEVERLKSVSTIEQRTIQGLQKTPEWSEIARLTAYCRELEAKINRFHSLFANCEWQPIETAPMDTTDVLCFCVEPEFEGEENPHTEMRVCFFGQMQEDYWCWMSSYGYEQRPTHWMCLPKPPIT